MVVYCSVRGCISKKKLGNGINFYRFPTKQQQKEQWFKALNITSIESSNSYVCSKHFEDKYFLVNNEHRILLPGAVPSKMFPSIYTKNTRNLVSIRPKPSSTFVNTTQKISSNLLPIVVVVDPMSTGKIAIPASNSKDIHSIFKANANQNNTNLETAENHAEIIYPVFNTVSENIEINNSDEENNVENEDTLSSISINSDTADSPKLNESCYVLVEVNDKKEGNLNTDEAKIVASGLNIKELINEAKIAIYDKHKVQPKPQRNRKIWRTKNIGDCVYEDMENPIIRKYNWTLALNEIQKLRQKVKSLEQKNRRLQFKLDSTK